MAFCEKCGADVGDGNFCQSCGAQLNAGSAENPYVVGSQTQTSGVVSADPNEVAPDIPTFLEAYPMFWKKWNTYRERSSRTEFWYDALWQLIILIPFNAIIFLPLDEGESVGSSAVSIALLCVLIAYGIASLMPWLNLVTRRLHDANCSGGWIILCFIPQIGGLATIIFGLLSPTQGPNRYGLPPKRRND